MSLWSHAERRRLLRLDRSRVQPLVFVAVQQWTSSCREGRSGPTPSLLENRWLWFANSRALSTNSQEVSPRGVARVAVGQSMLAKRNTKTHDMRTHQAEGEAGLPGSAVQNPADVHGTIT